MPTKKRSGSIRRQLRDPLNPERRISLSGPADVVEGRAKEIARVRARLRHGQMTQTEASAQITGEVHGAVTVEQAWRAYEKGVTASWKKQARAIWTHRLAPTFGKLACVEVTESVMRAWVAEQSERGMAPATIANASNVLRAMFNLQIADKRLAGLPWGRYKAPKAEPRKKREACRNISELQRLVDAALERDQQTRSTGRYADLAFRVLVMTLCGLRQGEAAGLGWADVKLELDPPLLYVRRQATDGWRAAHPDWTEPQDPVKGKKAETQVLHPSAALALSGQCDNLKAHGFYRPNGPVFPGRGAEWRSHADCIDIEDFRLLVRRAGLPDAECWVVHSLRHSFATLEVVASGGDLKAVQERMRHSNMRLLERYTHATGRGLAVSQIPQLRLPEPSQTRLLLPPSPPLPPELAPFAAVAEDRTTTAEIVNVTTEAARAAERTRLERRRETRRRAQERYRGRALPDYDRALATWDGTGKRPPEITGCAERNRQRARAEWLRKHPGEERVANQKGTQSFKATLGSWYGFLKKRGVGARVPIVSPQAADDRVHGAVAASPAEGGRRDDREQGTRRPWNWCPECKQAVDDDMRTGAFVDGSEGTCTGCGTVYTAVEATDGSWALVTAGEEGADGEDES